MRGINRVTATELSFFMAIPALTAAGIFEAARGKDALVAARRRADAGRHLVAFGTAYASIAWLLRFVASNSLRPFIWYRIALGLAVIVALTAGLDHRHLSRAGSEPAAALERAVQRAARQRPSGRGRRSSRSGTRRPRCATLAVSSGM